MKVSWGEIIDRWGTYGTTASRWQLELMGHIQYRFAVVQSTGTEDVWSDDIL